MRATVLRHQALPSDPILENEPQISCLQVPASTWTSRHLDLFSAQPTTTPVECHDDRSSVEGHAAGSVMPATVDRTVMTRVPSGSTGIMARQKNSPLS
jgi:hypothetical protein